MYGVDITRGWKLVCLKCLIREQKCYLGSFLLRLFLLEGEFPILDLLGIVFGHVYHYLRGVGGIGRCPSIVKEWYENSDDDVAKAVRSEYKKISSEFVMQ
mmetsp:Transcript_9291/g.10803  ORF Transcript_9291/g.10803 Transcript_9291/m.10803 type:complete len:100 (-) Transcript_9291:472-771(-)